MVGSLPARGREKFGAASLEQHWRMLACAPCLVGVLFAAC